MGEAKMISLTINGQAVCVPEGTTILAAARGAGIEIPTLCYLDGIEAFGGCRLCVVEVQRNGRRSLVSACSELCSDGSAVETETENVAAHRRFVLDLMLSNHFSSCFNCKNHDGCEGRQVAFCNYDENCYTCGKLDTCKLHAYAVRYGLDWSSYSSRTRRSVCVDRSNPIFLYDPNHCIRCRRCARTCAAARGDSLIGVLGRGIGVKMAFPTDEDCRACGKCVDACPTGALSIREST